jgi:flagellar biosynthesis protein FliQ
MSGKRIFTVATFVVLALIVGVVVGLVRAGEFTQVGLGMAFIIPALIALFGMFWIASNWKDALTAAFAVTYFIFIGGLISIFVLPGRNLALEGAAEALLNNYTALVGVVMVAYFGQEAVRAGAQAFRDSKALGTQAMTTGQPAAPGSMVQIDTNASPPLA